MHSGAIMQMGCSKYVTCGNEDCELYIKIAKTKKYNTVLKQLKKSVVKAKYAKVPFKKEPSGLSCLATVFNYRKAYKCIVCSHLLFIQEDVKAKKYWEIDYKLYNSYFN